MPSRGFRQPYKLDERKSPTTVDEFLQLKPDYKGAGVDYKSVAVKELQGPKAAHTFEVETTQESDGQTLVIVFRYYYGKNLEQVVAVEALRPAYEKLRPTFEQILQSFRPSNLDLHLLPAHP